MRRLIFWYIPVGAAIVATVAFGAGFYSFLRGDIGKPVDVTPARRIEAPKPVWT